MQLLYFADPMCSWCWGFSPVAREITERYPQTPFAVFLGGLRPGTTEPLSAKAKDEIRTHWEHVQKASGQPFDHSFFDREAFIYDTEPACRAVVTMRRLMPQRSLSFLCDLQRAFYRDNLDVTDKQVLCDLASTHADGDSFRQEFDTPETRQLTENDFSLARELGITGYPTLVGEHEQKLTALTIGYRPIDDVVTAIECWSELASK